MPKVNELITRVRLRIKDPGAIDYSSFEMIDYFNDAADFVSMELIAQKDPNMIKEIEHDNGSPLPDDFVEFAGQHPVYQKNGSLFTNDDAAKVKIRYFAKRARTTDAQANSPFKSMYDTVLVQLTALYASSRDTGGIPTDAEMLNQIRQSIGVIKKQQQAAQG